MAIARDPGVTVTVTDLGGHREVSLPGPHRAYGRLVPAGERFDTSYRQSTVERLLAVKGAEWLKDEIDRSEDADYLPRSLATLFSRHVPLAGGRVLDFGAGCGATSVVLGRLGAVVVGVDPDAPSVAAARLRTRDAGVAADFCRIGQTAALPFPEDAFDAVLAYQVFEHIPPPARAAHARELWRVLRPGGRLMISAPNRMWPFEFHTTQLWWIPWLPDGPAARYAVWRGRLPSGAIDDPALAEGMRGVSLGEVRGWLPAREARWLNLDASDGLADWLDLSLARPQPAWRRRVKRGLFALLRALDSRVLAPLGWPAAACLPYLNVVIEKSAPAGAPFDP